MISAIPMMCGCFTRDVRGTHLVVYGCRELLSSRGFLAGLMHPSGNGKGLGLRAFGFESLWPLWAFGGSAASWGI